jgi:hypothetical protein
LPFAGVNLPWVDFSLSLNLSRDLKEMIMGSKEHLVRALD